MSDIKKLWAAQPIEVPDFREEELRRKATAFQRKIRRRNAIEVLAAMIVVIGFGSYILILDQLLLQVGSAMLIAAAIFSMWQLFKRAGSSTLPGEAGLPCREFHIAELARQRDALRSAWLWYIGPALPGMVVFRIGVNTALPPDAPFIIGWGSDLVIAAVVIGIVLLNLHAANKLQRQIDSLEKEFA